MISYPLGTGWGIIKEWVRLSDFCVPFDGLLQEATCDRCSVPFASSQVDLQTCADSMPFTTRLGWRHRRWTFELHSSSEPWRIIWNEIIQTEIPLGIINKLVIRVCSQNCILKVLLHSVMATEKCLQVLQNYLYKFNSSRAWIVYCFVITANTREVPGRMIVCHN